MQFRSFRRPRIRINAIVLKTIQVTPLVRRLVLGGPNIAAWLATAGIRSPAAWVKVFPSGREGRAYTIRRVSDESGTIEIDFVLHHEDDGHSDSVSDWAGRAEPGDQVDIAGPRDGGFSLSPNSQWLWLGADASALPAAQTILESLPAGIYVGGVAVVRNYDEHQALQTAAHVDIHWRHTLEAVSDLQDADPILLGISLLRGPGQVWVAGEADWAQGWRTFWSEARDFNCQHVETKGYWKVGERDHRD